MSKDTEFPKSIAIDMHYQHTGGDYKSFYEKEPVNEWFRRCLEDYPKYAARGFEDDGSISVVKHAPKLYEWFEKWFGQFEMKKNE